MDKKGHPMKCLWCMRREAVVDGILCQFCDGSGILSQEDKQRLRASFKGQARLLTMRAIELKQAVKAELPRPIRWLFNRLFE